MNLKKMWKLLLERKKLNKRARQLLQSEQEIQQEILETQSMILNESNIEVINSLHKHIEYLNNEINKISKS